MAAAPASLLDLPDELYGLIYERIDSADSRRAFRHAHSVLHRSRAVNDRLTSVSIAHSDHLVSCLAAFPRWATLRWLKVSKCGDVGACLAQTTQPTGESAAARTCLGSVHHLTIENSTITEKCVSPLIDCFPKLREGGEGACLELYYCNVKGRPIGSCLAAFNLQRLALVRSDDLYGINGGALFSQLARATSVKHLLVECSVWDAWGVAPLKMLTQLTSLELYNIRPYRLQEVLAALPALQVLGVELDCYPRGEEQPWSSRTVKHIFVPAVFPCALAISTADFPALKTFKIGGVNFLYEEYAHIDKEEHLDDVRDMASWLSALPLIASCCPTEKLLNMKSAFCLKDLANYSLEANSHHVAACLHALSSLPPIKRALSEVKALLVDGFESSPESLGALTELFRGVEELTLLGAISRALPLSLGPLLLLCMRGLPHLWYWHIDLCDMHDAHEIIVLLIEARETRSRFELHVGEEAGLDEYAALEVVAAQWAKVTSLLPRGPPVTMTVMPA